MSGVWPHVGGRFASKNFSILILTMDTNKIGVKKKALGTRLRRLTENQLLERTQKLILCSKKGTFASLHQV